MDRPTHRKMMCMRSAEIAKPDNAAPSCKGGHRETCFSARVDAYYKFMFAAGSII